MHVFYVFATTHFNCQGGGILPYVREDISSKWFINLKISDKSEKKKKKKNWRKNGYFVVHMINKKQKLHTI